MSAPFFLKVHEIDGGQEKNYILSLAVTPPGHISPCMTKNTRFIRILGDWGLFLKRVERQGKSTQSLRIEVNNLPPNFGTPSMTC